MKGAGEPVALGPPLALPSRGNRAEQKSAATAHLDLLPTGTAVVLHTRHVPGPAEGAHATRPLQQRPVPGVRGDLLRRELQRPGPAGRPRRWRAGYPSQRLEGDRAAALAVLDMGRGHDRSAADPAHRAWQVSSVPTPPAGSWRWPAASMGRSRWSPTCPSARCTANRAVTASAHQASRTAPSKTTVGRPTAGAVSALPHQPSPSRTRR